MTWKTAAIVFIILFTLETAWLVYVYSLGFEGTKKEAECSNVICYKDGYTSYTYDWSTDICECYANGELVHTGVIK